MITNIIEIDLIFKDIKTLNNNFINIQSKLKNIKPYIKENTRLIKYIDSNIFFLNQVYNKRNYNIQQKLKSNQKINTINIFTRENLEILEVLKKDFLNINKQFN